MDESDLAKTLSRMNADSESLIYDIGIWVENEQCELKYNINQTHELLELKERLEQMVKGIQTPLEITQENLVTRETRQGVELVHDAVEDCLHKEHECLKRNQDHLLSELDKVNGQLSRLRTTRIDLESDLRNKEETKKMEDCVKILSKLRDELGDLDVFNDDEMAVKSSSSSWIAVTQGLISRSQDERSTAQMLYAQVSRSMLSSADQCFSIWYDTNASFNVRVAELLAEKHKIERNLHRAKHDIESLNRHMAVVRKTLEDKLSMLRIAQSRLDKRKDRPGVELCRDKVMLALLKEINVLKEARDKIMAKYKDMENTMTQLMKTKFGLEQDIKMKTVALFLDREKCLTLRQNFPMSTFKETRFPKELGSAHKVPESYSQKAIHPAIISD